ncbi:WhiB family transcriptional regulator [Nocardia cyriacigeorgica]|uniref:WhiB family transcriptional regulator n=1 Tax=Nocardia cyriacigeorgica TaxID=135487 RepID=UPI002458F22B|nr:WhiB family transcriptional regulator [Nocardia cyriacigeorgica]
MSTQFPIDPARLPERACNGVDQDVFFPLARQTTRVRLARQLCETCPVLVQCAEYALAMAEAEMLSDCVIASVHLPGDRAAQELRDAALGDLASIAARAAYADLDGVA